MDYGNAKQQEFPTIKMFKDVNRQTKQTKQTNHIVDITSAENNTPPSLGVVCLSDVIYIGQSDKADKLFIDDKKKRKK